MRQHLHSSSLEQHIEELRRANAILRSSTPPPSDATREMLDERTHAIIHLEHHIEQQDLELKERAAMIADLEQQLQVLHLQVPCAPAAPTAPAEPDAESEVDEE
jgi:hypothetical protein